MVQGRGLSVDGATILEYWAVNHAEWEILGEWGLQPCAEAMGRHTRMRWTQAVAVQSKETVLSPPLPAPALAESVAQERGLPSAVWASAL